MVTFATFGARIRGMSMIRHEQTKTPKFELTRILKKTWMKLFHEVSLSHSFWGVLKLALYYRNFVLHQNKLADIGCSVWFLIFLFVLGDYIVWCFFFFGQLNKKNCLLI